MGEHHIQHTIIEYRANNFAQFHAFNQFFCLCKPKLGDFLCIFQRI